MVILGIVVFLSVVTFGALALSTYRKDWRERPLCRFCGKNPTGSATGACVECLL